MPRSLYLHIPFCPKICPYCDFHKMRRDEGLVAAYLRRLEQEALTLYSEFPGSLDTIYLGGGTPSHLSDEELEKVVGIFQKTWGWPARLETTLEADPLTFDAARLQTFHALGFNRLSIGLQSTQDKVLKFLGRRHTGVEGLQAVEIALEAGFETSADLITAVSGQDAAEDLHALAQTGVPHVSVYNLTIEPYTPFARRGVVVDADKEADDYALADAVLSGYRLERYEVSSHAKTGHESKHNQVYWHGDYFLALGPSAAGFVPVAKYLPSDRIGERRTNGPIKSWLEHAPPDVMPVDAQDYVLDVLMTGLRTKRGVDLARLGARSGVNVRKDYREVLGHFIEEGWLELTETRLRATEAGLLRLNPILRAFFEAAPPVYFHLNRTFYSSLTTRYSNTQAAPATNSRASSRTVSSTICHRRRANTSPLARLKESWSRISFKVLS